MNEYEKDLLRVFDENLPFDALRGKNILIAGANGLIGSALIDALMLNAEDNYNVYALGRNEGQMKTRFRRYEDDFRFHTLIHDVCEPLDYNVHFDYIIDAASPADPASFATHPVDVIKTNVNGVANLMEYGIRHKMKRFMFISSGEVYGDCQNTPIKESDSGYVDCTIARSCYPSAKRAAEAMCASYSSTCGVDFVIARLCHVYGPNFTDRDSRAYAQFFRSASQGTNIVLESDGATVRSWCYIADVVSGIFHILLKGECGKAYNIADEESCISIKCFAIITARLANVQIMMHNRVIINPQKVALSSLMNNHIPQFDTSRLKGLGWKTLSTIERNISHSLSVLRNL